MQFPQNKKFAFTIIDDTDEATIENIKPVYELLAKLGFRTTKTVWTHPSRNSIKGLTLDNYQYRQFIKKLQRDGFEIAWHSVGSGRFTRQDILDGLEIFRQFIGDYPKIHINHSQNPDNMYWGIKRFSLLKPFWRFSRFKGENPESAYFWGDYHKKYIQYTRNFTFKSINTTKIDRFMPYKEKSKKEFSNYWFSSSDGENLEKFNRLTRPENIERLKEQGGACLVYTHLASGFVRAGRLDRTFQRQMAYLSREPGWFVPAGELLDYLLKQDDRGKEIPTMGKLGLEMKWVLDKVSSR